MADATSSLAIMIAANAIDQKVSRGGSLHIHVSALCNLI
jgi:hypothetical protein